VLHHCAHSSSLGSSIALMKSHVASLHAESGLPGPTRLHHTMPYASRQRGRCSLLKNVGVAPGPRDCLFTSTQRRPGQYCLLLLLRPLDVSLPLFVADAPFPAHDEPRSH